MSASELETELIELRRQINLLELRFARTSAHFARTFDPDLSASDDPDQWLREECRMTSHAAYSAIDIGELEPQLTASIAALTSGEIGLNHLSWMAHTASRLQQSATATSPFDEQKLLSHAKENTVQRFRRKCDQFIHEADHQTFVREQVDGVEARRLTLTTYEDGSVALDAILDPEGGAVVKAAIEPFAQKHSANDYRGLSQRRADALVEVLSHLLDNGAVPQRSGQRPHLHVTTTLETLLDHVGSPPAELETGALLSGTTISRLACDSTMVRVLLNSESMVVDVGRAKRVVPTATRRALNVRDRGCVWPGCDRNASWTQAHHLIHWTDGGLTDMNNLVLLCRRHHWMAHEGGYVIVRSDEGALLTFATHPAFGPAGRDPTLIAA